MNKLILISGLFTFVFSSCRAVHNQNEQSSLTSSATKKVIYFCQSRDPNRVDLDQYKLSISEVGTGYTALLERQAKKWGAGDSDVPFKPVYDQSVALDSPKDTLPLVFMKGKQSGSEFLQIGVDQNKLEGKWIVAANIMYRGKNSNDKIDTLLVCPVHPKKLVSWQTPID